MSALAIVSDFTSLGAAGIMGAMWLWERRASTVREKQLTDAHQRIMRDEERLGQLTKVVTQNTAALAQFNQTQRDMYEILRNLLEELQHEKTKQ